MESLLPISVLAPICSSPDAPHQILLSARYPEPSMRNKDLAQRCVAQPCAICSLLSLALSTQSPPYHAAIPCPQFSDPELLS
jgi:hypothetical protein